MSNKTSPFVLVAVLIALVLHSDQVFGGTPCECRLPIGTTTAALSVDQSLNHRLVNRSFVATEEQMIAAGKLMRDVCLPKFNKITAEVADGIREGNVPDTKDVKCYINCVMEMMQTMKKGKFLYESSLKQVDLLMPDSYKDEYRNGLGKCKDAASGIKNNCDASYAVLICMRDNISKFVFP